MVSFRLKKNLPKSKLTNWTYEIIIWLIIDAYASKYIVLTITVFEIGVTTLYDFSYSWIFTWIFLIVELSYQAIFLNISVFRIITVYTGEYSPPYYFRPFCPNVVCSLNLPWIQWQFMEDWVRYLRSFCFPLD